MTLCITIPVAFIALIAAIAIPNLIRARATASAFAGITGIRALKSSLELYRSMKNHYPATADWSLEMFPVGAESLAPVSFKTFNRLSGYVVNRYRFSYESEGKTNYSLQVVPQELGAGAPSFYTDANPDGTIYHCTVSAESQEASAHDRALDEPAARGGSAK